MKKVYKTLKSLIKEDIRRIIFYVNSIFLSRKKNGLLSLQCYFILEFKIRDGYVCYTKLINEYMNIYMKCNKPLNGTQSYEDFINWLSQKS